MGNDGGMIRVLELGREVRPKPEKMLSKLQTDPHLRGPWEQMQHGYTGLASEPTGVGAAPYPEQGRVRSQDSDVARSLLRSLRFRELIQEEFWKFHFAEWLSGCFVFK